MNIATDAQPWTIAALLAWSRDYFARHGIDESRLTAELLLCSVLGCRRIDLYLKFDMVLQADELARYKAFVKRRLAREPLQYIVGETEFMGLKLQVDRRVLIPRPETEMLVETVVERSRAFPSPGILDIGTGSGNIAISLARLLPAARIVAIDVSRDALETARANCRLHDCAARIRLLEGDVRTMTAQALGAPFDIVVSNPPYVSRDEFAGVQPEVRDHEPRLATTDEADGLTFHRVIIDRARSWLGPRGLLALEVGFCQAGAVETLCAAAGYTGIAVTKDLGGIERIVTAEWSV